MGTQLKIINPNVFVTLTKVSATVSRPTKEPRCWTGRCCLFSYPPAAALEALSWLLLQHCLACCPLHQDRGLELVLSANMEVCPRSPAEACVLPQTPVLQPVVSQVEGCLLVVFVRTKPMFFPFVPIKTLIMLNTYCVPGPVPPAVRGKKPNSVEYSTGQMALCINSLGAWREKGSKTEGKRALKT